MITERLLTVIVKNASKRQLALKPTNEKKMPAPEPGRKYMLYMHVPFCQRLCPYCSFNRYPFQEHIARPYFANMRKEMMMLKEQGYDFESLYIGGGTPTIMLDELCDTIDLARENFSITEVSSETNPNHLTKEYLEKLTGRVQRLSVGVQSFDNTLLKEMDRYWKYGSGEEIVKRIEEAVPYFDSLNIDMIFNFPSQSEKVLRKDIETIINSSAHQVTFSPLYVSTATQKKMAQTLGKLDYNREYEYYKILDELLTDGDKPKFKRTTLWTFNRIEEDEVEVEDSEERIEEYMTSYEDYPGIGSGAITHLDGALYVNSFSLAEYNEAIENGNMSIAGKTKLSKRDLMRYRFVLQLYKLRLDKKQFIKDFGVSVEKGLRAEMTYMRFNKAFETDNENELTLTPFGRYLTLVMYREFLSGMNNLRDQARDRLVGPERELVFGEGEPDLVKAQEEAEANSKK